MIVKGFPIHVASAIMPFFITCASIWPKPAISAHASSLFGDKDAGGPYHRVYDVAGPQCELLDGSGDTGPNHGFVQFDLCLLKRSFCTRLLRGQQR